MILLTKLDNSPVAVSLEAIKYIETMPDTLVFFLNGDSIIVKESVDAIMKLVIELKSKIIKEAQK
ncbi:MAG: flagellar FlbD family protein [Deltaproteobacteria bacterium]|nr:flagellar FlbD family protein [Deltaproteobacteria bacterium]